MQEEKSQTNSVVALVIRSLYRSRIAVLTVALTYFLAVIIGILMVHTGNGFALASRDRIVSNAQSSPILMSLAHEDRLRAALLDFSANLFAAILNTIGGLGVVLSYPVIAYRGWIGGIVSVDGAHVSRLADPWNATYYVVTLVLQLIPYSLAGGAGVNMGLAFYRPMPYYRGQKWLGIPREAILDVARIYLLVVPMFLLASLWEFFLAS
jgi:uncharacterized membrane protein SpoIIM required for sporulation